MTGQVPWSRVVRAAGKAYRSVFVQDDGKSRGQGRLLCGSMHLCLSLWHRKPLDDPLAPETLSVLALHWSH